MAEPSGRRRKQQTTPREGFGAADGFGTLPWSSNSPLSSLNGNDVKEAEHRMRMRWLMAAAVSLLLGLVVLVTVAGEGRPSQQSAQWFYREERYGGGVYGSGAFLGGNFATTGVVWSLDDHDDRQVRWLRDSMDTFLKRNPSLSLEDDSIALIVLYSLTSADNSSSESSSIARDGSARDSPPYLTCEMLSASIDGARGCESTVITPTAGIHPENAKNPLRAGHVHILNMNEDDWWDELKPIFRLEEYINAMETEHLEDLASSTANHLRFMLDAILLPLGLRKALYLDTDTCIEDTLMPLLRSEAKEAIVVARRHDRYGVPTDEYTWESIYWDRVATMRERAGGGGVSPRRQAPENVPPTEGEAQKHFPPFNAGVMLFDLQKLRELRLFDRMYSVLEYHNSVEHLWFRGTNQPALEIALSMGDDDVKFVSPFYNCRNMQYRHSTKGCYVVHQKACRLTANNLFWKVKKGVGVTVKKALRRAWPPSGS